MKMTTATMQKPHHRKTFKTMYSFEKMSLTGSLEHPFHWSQEILPSICEAKLEGVHGHERE